MAKTATTGSMWNMKMSDDLPKRAHSLGVRVAQALKTLNVKIVVGDDVPLSAVDLLGTSKGSDPVKPARTFEERLGRCFELAGYAVLGGDAPEGSRLVHGSWDGPGAKNGRIPHAWVELPGSLIWEPITARIYDAIEFRLWVKAWDERTYVKKQAAQLALSSNNFGPWHESRYDPQIPKDYTCDSCPFETGERREIKNHAAILGHMGWSDNRAQV
jgi:hypothetical protein